MGNLERKTGRVTGRNLERNWLSVAEEKMGRFDDVVNRLKSAISHVKKKEEAKAKHEEILSRKRYSEGGCKKS